MSGSGAQQQLRVDWPRCRAHGLCAGVLPELLWLDQWGYPVIDGDTVPPALVDQARRAARSGPELALRLVDAPQARTSARS